MESGYAKFAERDRQLFTNPKLFVLFAVLCNFLWGGALPFIKWGYKVFAIGETDIFSLIVFAGLRLFLAGLIVLIFCRIRGTKIWPRSKSEWGCILKLSAMSSVLQYIFLYIGAALSTGVEASILSGSGAFMGIIFSSLIFKEDKLTTRKIAGCLLGFAAIVLLNFQDLAAGVTLSIGGGLLIVVSQAMGILGGIYLKYIAQNKDAMWLGSWQTICGGAMLLLIGSMGGGSIRFSLSADCFNSLAVLLLFSALALVLSNQLYKYNDISKFAIYTFLLPIFGTTVSAAVLHESLASPMLLVSLLMTCLGVYLVNRPEKKQMSRAGAKNV